MVDWNEILRKIGCGVNTVTPDSINLGIFSWDIHDRIATTLHCGCEEAIVCRIDDYGQDVCDIVPLPKNSALITRS